MGIERFMGFFKGEEVKPVSAEPSESAVVENKAALPNVEQFGRPVVEQVSEADYPAKRKTLEQLAELVS